MAFCLLGNPLESLHPCGDMSKSWSHIPLSSGKVLSRELVGCHERSPKSASHGTVDLIDGIITCTMPLYGIENCLFPDQKGKLACCETSEVEATSTNSRCSPDASISTHPASVA